MCGKMKGRQSVSFADAGVEKETEKKEAPYGSLKSEMMNASQPVMAMRNLDIKSSLKINFPFSLKA